MHLLSYIFFFNIYCSLKNRNTCLYQPFHGIPDEKPLKKNNKMQLESKCVKLPRHPQLGPVGSSWEDADSPPAVRPQNLRLGGLLLSSSTYQTSPFSLFSAHYFPTLEFALNKKRHGIELQENRVAVPLLKTQLHRSLCLWLWIVFP